jgi:hypothetical protein
MLMTGTDKPDRKNDPATVRDKAILSAVAQHIDERLATILASAQALTEEKVAAIRASTEALARELHAGVRDVQSLAASTDATLRRIEEERLRLTAVNVERMNVLTTNVGEWLDRCAMPPEFAPATVET